MGEIQKYLSIITPTLNAEKVILPTILSIKNQTFSRFVEHLVIDGKSTDETLKILYENNWNNLIIISEPDKGIYDAMNKGLKRASGKYVMFLNAGDILASPQVVEKFIRVTSQQDIDFYYGRFLIWKDNRYYKWHKETPPPHLLSWRSFLKGMVVNHQTMIVKRELAPFFDLKYKYVADIDWSIRLFKQNLKVYFEDEIITIFLGEGFSKKHRIPSLFERIKIMLRYGGLFKTLGIHFQLFLNYGKDKPVRRDLSPWEKELLSLLKK